MGLLLLLSYCTVKCTPPSNTGLLSLFFRPNCLPCLCVLSGLNRWEDIEKLNFFPKLEEVRLQGIPLLQTYTNAERRSLMIAQ